MIPPSPVAGRVIIFQLSFFPPIATVKDVAIFISYPRRV